VDGIPLRELGYCRDCKAQLKTQRQRHSKLEQIGRGVEDTKSLTVYTYHQCQTCGEVWERLEDFDPSSRGRYLMPMRVYRAGPADWS
jgi:hypothetical protein